MYRICINILIIFICTNIFAKPLLDEGKFFFQIKNKDLQIVTLIANKAKISEILSEIYSKTGITVKIEKNRQDEEITLSLDNVPLSSLFKRML